jgi:hypothetical protein
MAGTIQWIRTKVDTNPILTRFLVVSTVLILVMAAYLLFFRPYQLQLGATDTEITRSMPGDELNRNPSFLATRAITIDGTPEEIWPWLIQMGYGRAGFYGYDILENMGSPGGLRSAERIVPELQAFEVGDEVPISAVVSMSFGALEAHRYLIWVGYEDENPGAFTWALYPIVGNQTRLVSRIRWSYDWTAITTLPLQLFTEFADHIAVRKILQGVKGRVENDVEPTWVQNAEFLVYLVTLLTFIAALVLIVSSRLSWQSWWAGLLTGGVWLSTWYTPVATWLSALFALTGIAALCVVFRRRRECN